MTLSLGGIYDEFNGGATWARTGNDLKHVLATSPARASSAATAGVHFAYNTFVAALAKFNEQHMSGELSVSPDDGTICSLPISPTSASSSASTELMSTSASHQRRSRESLIPVLPRDIHVLKQSCVSTRSKGTASRPTARSIRLQVSESGH